MMEVGAGKQTGVERRVGGAIDGAAPGLLSRKRFFEDITTPVGDQRKLELVSVRQGDGLDSLLTSMQAREESSLLSLLDRAAQLHDAELYVLTEDVYAFLTPRSETGSPATTAAAFVSGTDSAIVFGDATFPDEAKDGRQALALAVERLRTRARLRQTSPERQVRAVLLQAFLERGIASGTPGPNVVAAAVAVGRRLGLSLSRLDLLLRAAELHHIGKLSVPEAILLKRGPLTEAEWTVVQRHPLAAERILKASPSMFCVARIVRSCFESYDGTGYPDGLKGNEIPLESRIIAVCAAFDAMTSPRPYRSPRSLPAAVGELRSRAGTQFDPVVVAHFSDLELGRDVGSGGGSVSHAGGHSTKSVLESSR